MIFEEEDLAYEEDCIRNPHSLKTWSRFIEHKIKGCTNWVSVYLIYERSLKQLPGRYFEKNVFLMNVLCYKTVYMYHKITLTFIKIFIVLKMKWIINFSYKLWYNYLKLRRSHLKAKCINDPEYEEVNDVYERSLAYMNKVCHKNI